MEERLKTRGKSRVEVTVRKPLWKGFRGGFRHNPVDRRMQRKNRDEVNVE